MKKILCFLASFLLCAAMLPLAVFADDNRPYASCEQEYQRVGDIIPDVYFEGKGTGTAVAGMALVGDYAYSVKLKGNAKPSGDTTNYHLNEPSVLFRTNIVTGETVQLTPSDGKDGLNYVTYIHHANGLAGYHLDGKTYLLAATLVSGEQALVKVLVEGDCYRKVGEYQIMESGKSVSKSGIDILSVDGEKTALLLKSGKTFYTAELPHAWDDGTVLATKQFTIDLSRVTVGDVEINATVSTASGYNWQDCGYHKGILYVPVSGPKNYYSIIAVYEILNEDGSLKTGQLQPLPGKSVNIGGGICQKIELESVAVGKDGKLYFNANANSLSGNKIFDGVFSTANPIELPAEEQPTTPPAEPLPAEPEAPSTSLVWILPMAAALVISGGCVGYALILKKKK